MRAWLLRIHLYGGLLCVPYLVIFGLSSLHFNHQFAFARTPANAPTNRWERAIGTIPGGDAAKVTAAVRDQLGLMGWPLPWETKRDPDGSLHFPMERPGMKYRIDVQASDGVARVQEIRKGFWSVFLSLHALTELPNSRLMSGWGVYTELCTAVVLFSAASGIWLWWSARRDRPLGTTSLGLGLLGSAGFILFVVLHG